MPTILNNDCWSLVADQLFGDFRSLARMMQTSKPMLAIFAPRLYSQLGHPTNTKVIKNWSLKKRSHLATLLFTSSGCINPNTDTEEFQNLYRCQLRDPTFEFYQAPLALDYFGLLKQLPLELIDNVIWKMLIEDEKQCKESDSRQDGGDVDGTNWQLNDDTARQKIDQRHARVFSEIVFKTQRDWDRWLTCTEDFAQLSKITLHYFKPYSDLRTKAIEFVTRHKAAFPGQLIEIEGDEKFLTDFVMELNQILVPKRIRLLEMYRVDSLSSKEKTLYLSNLKEFIYHGNTKIKFRGLSKDEMLMEVQNLEQDLRLCRRLERIDIQLYYFLPIRWEGFLSWAPQERLEYQLVESQLVSSQMPNLHSLRLSTPSCSPLLSLSSFGFPVESRSLVPVKEFIGYNIQTSVLVNVMDGFRYTLERIVFQAKHVRDQNHMDWSWSLSRLRTLRLSQCYLFVSKIKFWCPALEELYLEACWSTKEKGETVPTWQLPTRLKRLSLINGIGIKDLDLESIGELNRLESLCLIYTHSDATTIQNPIKSPTWNLLPKLRHLRLDGDANLEWQRHLLQASPILESFASSDKSISFSDSWWNEIKTDEGYQGTTHQSEKKVTEEEIKTTGQLNLNGKNTNLKSIRFVSDDTLWSCRQIQDLSEILEQKSLFFSPLDHHQPSSVPPNFENQWIFFPFLAYVLFDSSQSPFTIPYPTCGEFDRLLMVLMSRPHMRRILTVFWRPSRKLIETELENVDENELPNSIQKYDRGYNILEDGSEHGQAYDDSNDECWGKGPNWFCVLARRGRGRKYYHYRLRQRQTVVGEQEKEEIGCKENQM